MSKKSSLEQKVDQPFHFSRQLGLQVGAAADQHEPILTAVDQEEQILTASQPAYTEGGLVFLPHEDGKRTSSLDEKASRLSAILASYGDLDWGFKRRERLDVKKPGPPFLTNSFAYVVRDQIIILSYTSLCVSDIFQFSPIFLPYKKNVFVFTLHASTNKTHRIHC